MNGPHFSLLGFDFTPASALYLIAGAILAAAVLSMLWGALIYISANFDEEEWEESRVSILKGTVTITVLFCIWGLLYLFA